MKVLHLTLKKKFFDLIASGEKKEEYRDMKIYWLKRFFKPKYSISYEDYYPYEFLDELMKFPDCNLDEILRLFGACRVNFDVIQFKNGYGKNSPVIRIEFKGVSIGNAKPEWSDNWQGNVFVIKLGKIISQ